MPMNDPHVKAIHFYIQHDDSVDYGDVAPLVHDDALFCIRAKKRIVVLEPKCHYATEEEARSAAEEFVRRWEFEAALRTQSGAFRLEYEGVRIVDREPPPGVADPVYLNFRTSVSRVTVTKKLATFPAPPDDPAIDPDDPDAIFMLALLDRYRLNRARLGDVAYYCLTVLEDRAEECSGSKGGSRPKAAKHYQISECVLDSVGCLSDKKGGDDARKRKGHAQPFTEEEKIFLEAAVAAFIRRVAEKAADRQSCLCVIGKDDLTKLPN